MKLTHCNHLNNAIFNGKEMTEMTIEKSS